MVSEGALAPSGFPFTMVELVIKEGRQPLLNIPYAVGRGAWQSHGCPPSEIASSLALLAMTKGKGLLAMTKRVCYC